jgi:hypothetical protein
MKVLILCLLIGSIAAINQSQEDFKEVATSRISSGCVDRLPNIPKDCKKKLTCSKLQSQCNKTLWQVAKPGGKKCLSKLRKSDTKKKIYQFCARSCSMCTDGNWGQWGGITSCSKTCGGGTGTRTRLCDDPPQKGEGSDCPGSNTITVNCNEELCPVLRPTPALKPNTTPAPETTSAPKADDCCSEHSAECLACKDGISVQEYCKKMFLSNVPGCTGVSLKEYQNQVDIFKKSIDDQHRDMVKLKALLDKVQGDLSEEKTEREKSDQTEKESRRQSVAQIQGDLVEEMQHREASNAAITGNVTYAIQNVNGLWTSVDALEKTVVKRCQNDTDCGQSLICVDEWCVLPECMEDSQCPDSRRFCDIGDNVCKETCQTDSQCPDLYPFCDVLDGKCKECERNSQCSQLLPFCDTSVNTCKQCGDDTHCPEALPNCDITDNTCKECMTDSHCTSSSKPKCYDNICECRQTSDCDNDEYCWTWDYPDNGQDYACHDASIPGYQYELKTYCSGSQIGGSSWFNSWYTLDAAVSACSSNQECGCIDDTYCDGYSYFIYEGTGTKPSSTSPRSCSWMKN